MNRMQGLREGVSGAEGGILSRPDRASAHEYSTSVIILTF
jgi:hypothetical protein